MRVAIYARISTHDQQTLPIQLEAMNKFAVHRNWVITETVFEIGSGANKKRPERERILAAARRREIDVILVWKIDRWGRSLSDVVVTLKELSDLGVAFVSLTESLDFTTSGGKALAGMLAVFAEFEHGILRERIKAGIAKAKEQGLASGRPKSASLKAQEIIQLHSQGMSKSKIAKELGIGRTSVIRALVGFEKPLGAPA